MQQLLGVGGLLALRLKESVDTFPDQVLPSRPACRSQSAGFYGDDLPWIKTPHAHDQPALISTTASGFTLPGFITVAFVKINLQVQNTFWNNRPASLFRVSGFQLGAAVRFETVCAVTYLYKRICIKQRI